MQDYCPGIVPQKKNTADRAAAPAALSAGMEQHPGIAAASLVADKDAPLALAPAVSMDMSADSESVEGLILIPVCVCRGPRASQQQPPPLLRPCASNC